MRKIVFYTAICLLAMTTVFTSCEKYENLSELKGKSFTFDNQATGSLRHVETYSFAKDGHVTLKMTIGYSTSTTFEHFKYKLNGTTLSIYKDSHTYWSKEARNTLHETGVYDGNSITTSRLKYVLD